MSVERVKQYLSKWNRQGDVKELEVSTATSPLAAAALGVEVGRIAKSITLKTKEGGAVLVVVSGDGRIDNKKFKAAFSFPPKMLNADDAFKFTGYAVGGICPFDIPAAVPVYLDVTLKRFETVFPACGSASSMIELTIAEMEEFSGFHSWVDVCKLTESFNVNG